MINMKYRTVILPVVYGCQTRSLTLREVHRPRQFESRALKRIFDSRRDEITEDWRLHNEELLT
jgi:hypothetical protein